MKYVIIDGMHNLAVFGWNEKNQSLWDDMDTHGNHPARVVADFGTSLKIALPEIRTAELSGRLAHYSRSDEVPKVGDWVSVTITENNNATVETVVLRANEIARKVTGRRTLKQIIAANVDISFVLLSLDKDFSVERLKRFLYQLSVSSVEAIIVLNKADKTDVLQSYIKQLESLAVPIIVTTATEGIGVDNILARISPGKTAILLGSSGVGKSTLTNKLLGRNLQATKSVRESDDTGKHTTVHRELFLLPNGGILIDTPGIRELQLWGSEEALDINYDDIATLAAQCKYSNCRHTSEEGCVVIEALTDGTLNSKHYASFVKMKIELSNLANKNTEKIRQEKQRVTRQKKNKLNSIHDLNDGF